MFFKTTPAAGWRLAGKHRCGAVRGGPVKVLMVTSEKDLVVSAREWAEPM